MCAALTGLMSVSFLVFFFLQHPENRRVGQICGLSRIIKINSVTHKKIWFCDGNYFKVAVKDVLYIGIYMNCKSLEQRNGRRHNIPHTMPLPYIHSILKCAVS